MNFKKGQIVKVVIETGHIYGRVLTVDEHGDGTARFNSNGTIIVSAIMPEMVADAFDFTGKGRYDV